MHRAVCTGEALLLGRERLYCITELLPPNMPYAGRREPVTPRTEGSEAVRRGVWAGGHGPWTVGRGPEDMRLVAVGHGPLAVDHWPEAEGHGPETVAREAVGPWGHGAVGALGRGVWQCSGVGSWGDGAMDLGSRQRVEHERDAELVFVLHETFEWNVRWNVRWNI